MENGHKRICSNRKVLALALVGAAGLWVSAAKGDIAFLNVIASSGAGSGQVTSPLSCALAPNGNVYVADQDDNRIEVFSPTGILLSSFGSTGAGNGQFKDPFGVAVGPNGNVYVVDEGNNRVEIFNSANTFLSAFGSGGAGNGQFNEPFGIAVNSVTGSVYVVDANNSRIEMFSASGVFSSSFGSVGTGNGQFESPSAINIDSSNNVYVTDFTSDQVDIFNSAGAFQNSIGSPGTGNGQFRGADGVDIASNGLIYVSDALNNRIEVFTAAGAFESSFGNAGNGNGQFNFPTGIAVAPTGMVYVADTQNSRILRLFDPNAWVSGTNTFTNSAVGPTTVGVGSGQLLGTTFSLNPGMILNSTTLNPIAGGIFTQNGGGLSLTSMTLAGTFNYLSGAFTCGSITLSGNGIFNAINGGTLALTTTLTTGGSGSEVDLDDGTTMTAPSGVNVAGGLFVMGQATLSTNTVTISSGAELQLQNANQAIVQGNVTNTGLVDGSGRIVGTLQNNAAGQVAIYGSQSLTLTGSGNTNAGALQLAGGTLHFTQALSNSGSILGTGTLRVDGGLTNTGTLGLTGPTYVFASVTSSTTGIIHLSGNTPNIFYRSVANSGSLNVDAGAIGVFYGAYSGTGSINNNGSLFLQANSIAGPITGSGTITLGTGNSPAVLALTSLGSSDTQSAIDINTGSTLDLSDNSLTLSYGLPANDQIATIINLLRTGYDHGKWDGTGISSSAAAANTQNSTTLGYIDTGTQVLIKYTWVGDANLDGVVNSADLALMRSGGDTWSQGDFNYDGLVNADDYALFMLGTAYGKVNISTTLPEPNVWAAILACGLSVKRKR